MSKISPSKPRELIKFLEKQGFIETRQKGSHKFFRHIDGRTTVVPFHSSKPIGKGLLRKILRDVNAKPEDLMK